MTKEIKSIFVVLLTMISITGCGPIGEKTTSMSIIYGIAVAIAILMLCVYCAAIKEKSLWMVLLFSSILVVNIGYLTLSISDNLEEALLSNRIAYLGSVFLPMAMFMIIINACGIKYKKFLPFVLIGRSLQVRLQVMKYSMEHLRHLRALRRL